MRMTDARLYLRAKGISETTAHECAMPHCSNVFLAAEGVAFAGKNGEEVHIYLFCSYECYLAGFPKELCGRG